MNVRTLAALVVLLATFPVVVLADGRGADVVQIHSGPVKGRVEEGMRVFAGIPYAAPPVGELRWRPPQEVTPWTQGRDSTSFGPSCPQPRQKILAVDETAKYSEDCLYLNVWTTAREAGERLPVMVWIHGGAFNFGAGSQPEYNGANLARKGVVVVTINYRLGPLGFMVHPLLTKESPGGSSGNYGLLNQIAALKWVQRNIAAFGGDPGQVTIFGQSAGSRSVTLQMISPLSAGLFHRAIAVSGGPIIGSEYLSPQFNGNIAQVSKMGEQLASRIGADKAEDVLAAMRSKSAQEIVAVADCKTSVFDYEALFFAPVFDGWVLPRDPLKAYTSGQQHDVPIIVGSTRNEGTLYLADETNLTVDKYRSFLKVRFGADSGKAFELFPGHTAKDVAPAIDNILTVAANAQPARLVAKSMEQKSSKGYLFHFTRLPDTAMARKLGVYHGVEIAYVFGNMRKSDGYDDTDLRLSQEMMAYWVNFAKTGNPNGQGLKEWPAYESKSDLNLEFSDTIKVDRHLFKNKCDFIFGRHCRHWVGPR
jgi:para-nitrobenzyl esterase